MIVAIMRVMISLRVQRSTKKSYLLNWHKSQGLGLPIKSQNYAGIIGKHSLLVVLSCMVRMQIMTVFLVMMALIKEFQVQSHTPDLAATLFL